MAKVELRLPQMGESVAEATVTGLPKRVGDVVNVDETILEVATDKVDNEIPSEFSGKILEFFFKEGDVIKVDEVFAIIDAGESITDTAEAVRKPEPPKDAEPKKTTPETLPSLPKTPTNSDLTVESNRFYSPLIKSIAKVNNLNNETLSTIAGSGLNGRLTKHDILNYLEEKTSGKSTSVSKSIESGADKIIAMDRMRKIIALHMVDSLKTSAHVQSFIEVDVTKVVRWRDLVKANFEKQTGEKLTFTPIFIEAIAQVLLEFPILNSTVSGDSIIMKKRINIGMATALPNGNLIVPVVKDANTLSLTELAKTVNDLAARARNGKLKPDDTQGGTYTFTNIGGFGNLMGTPIINQPQVGILAVGAIRKVPAVIETPDGDYIGIRQQLFLSHSYDHRVIDGSVGGRFIKRLQDKLGNWDIKRVP